MTPSSDGSQPAVGPSDGSLQSSQAQTCIPDTRPCLLPQALPSLMLESCCKCVQDFSVGKGCQAHPAPAPPVTRPLPTEAPRWAHRQAPRSLYLRTAMSPGAFGIVTPSHGESLLGVGLLLLGLAGDKNLIESSQPARVRSCSHPESGCEKRASDRGGQPPGTQPQAGLVSPGELGVPASELIAPGLAVPASGQRALALISGSSLGLSLGSPSSAAQQAETIQTIQLPVTWT